MRKFCWITVIPVMKMRKKIYIKVIDKLKILITTTLRDENQKRYTFSPHN